MGALGEGSFGQVLLVRGKVRQPGPLNLRAFKSVQMKLLQRGAFVHENTWHLTTG